MNKVWKVLLPLVLVMALLTASLPAFAAESSPTTKAIGTVKVSAATYNGKKQTPTVKVYDTITRQFADVTVTKEVYDTYRRTEWNIKDNNDSFYAHEIQMSGLIGGEEDGYENFHEFVDDENTPDNSVINEELKRAVLEGVDELDQNDRELIYALFGEGMSGREYSRKSGIPQTTINYRKKKILDGIRKNKKFFK